MSGKFKRFEYGSLAVEFYTDTIEKLAIEALDNSSNETGGVLTGYYSEGREKAVIKSFHRQTPDSKGTRFNFIRGKIGLTSLMRNLWQNKEYYLGEWNLHPFNSSAASDVDIAQIRKISELEQYKCPEPILVIIGGGRENFNYSVYVVTNRVVNQMREISD